MKLFAFILIFLISNSNLWSQTILIDGDKGSYIEYFIRHPLHNVKAINNEAKFLIEFDVKKNQILKAEAIADVTKFDSGNSNRDSHVMELIEALKYPTVSFKSNDIKIEGEDIIAKGLLTFHGVTREITMIGKVNFNDDKTLIVKGNFQISLTDFKVKRPTLLFIKSDDTLKLSIYAKFNLPK
jgi:polyisoprenoid-binding protein YceI